MNEREEKMNALNEYLGHMEDVLEDKLGAETLDRYLYTNMIYWITVTRRIPHRRITG